MKPSPRSKKPPRQRSLPFLEMSGQVDLWNGFAEQQQQECLKALRHLLIAVARHGRNITPDNPESLAQVPEKLTHE
jgi:hypothetical protein